MSTLPQTPLPVQFGTWHWAVGCDCVCEYYPVRLCSEWPEKLSTVILTAFLQSTSQPCSCVRTALEWASRSSWQSLAATTETVAHLTPFCHELGWSRGIWELKNNSWKSGLMTWRIDFRIHLFIWFKTYILWMGKRRLKQVIYPEASIIQGSVLTRLQLSWIKKITF